MDELNGPEPESLQSIFQASIIKLEEKTGLHSCTENFSSSSSIKQRNKDYIVEVQKFNKNPISSVKGSSLTQLTDQDS